MQYLKSNWREMDAKAEYIDYNSTGYFSKLVTDYIQNDNKVKPFYNLPPNIEGIKKAIKNRQNIHGDRAALVDHLNIQYGSLPLDNKVQHNISSLLKEQAFTVCTAHQPNIFTGPLYFIYKIIHTIRLADSLNIQFPENVFVPVFYMGNEDADLEELGYIIIGNEKYIWNTTQTGAVGKMVVDDELIKLITKFSGQIQVQQFGAEILKSIRECYVKGIILQEATLRFVNKLFAKYGLVILIPDSPVLKRSMLNIFEDELFNNSSNKLVEKTNAELQINYKAQAHSREINLFYIDEQVRNRIIKNNNGFHVENTLLTFTKESIKKELHDHPEKFSPNVILRGLYQESILPNIAFIGGSGEIAYWLQLCSLFNHYNILFPVLILRNSFLIIDKKTNTLKNKLQIENSELFKDEIELINEMVLKMSSNSITAEQEKNHLHSIYSTLIKKAELIDSTLVKHVAAIEHRSFEKITALEKKMLRAEKRKYIDRQNQIKKLKSILFPNNSLQERFENIIPFYGKWGDDFINMLYAHSLTFEQKFCVLVEN